MANAIGSKRLMPPLRDMDAGVRRAFRDLLSVRAYREGRSFARDDVEYAPELMAELVKLALVDETGSNGELEPLYQLRAVAVVAASALGWCELSHRPARCQKTVTEDTPSETIDE